MSLAVLLVVASALPGQLPGQPFAPPPSKPSSPREEQASFRIVPGFRVELVASEPQVVDPVCLAFDERGRLFVAEMIGYPNGGVGTGEIRSGRIKLLEDRDGDGVYERATLFAEGLRFPTGLFPFRGGLVVANAPEILYLKDADGDGKAEIREILYSGFDLANIQQLVNGFTWGFDNRIHAQAGAKGGLITSPGTKATWTLRGRGLSFRPDRLDDLVPTSSGGQYGLAINEFGDWFVNTNAQHLRQLVLPDRYLGRNPYLAVTATTLDIPDHGPACKVHRISPFESWRVERTRRRNEDGSRKFASTELVPGGFVTSGCSPLVYLGGQFPEASRGDVFLCDPANNLIHRDRLEAKGPTYVAKRVHEDCEFLASTDNWFRPVFLAPGPDGAVYVADFYREVIETPLSLPEDMKKVLTLQTQARGRIWRIVAEGGPKPAVAPVVDLVAELGSPNAWRRFAAQRLLVEKNDPATAGALDHQRRSPNPMARVHALAALDGIGAVSEAQIVDALGDGDDRVKLQGLRMAEARLASARVAAAVGTLADDASPRVRYQVALALGYFPKGAPTAAEAFAKVAARDVGDPWTQTALLASLGAGAGPTLDRCLKTPALAKGGPAATAFLAKLAQLVAASGDDASLGADLQTLAVAQPASLRLALFNGYGQGLGQRGRTLAKAWANVSGDTRTSLDAAFAQATREAADDALPTAERLMRIQFLGLGPADAARELLPKLWQPQQPQEIQLAAVRAFAAGDHGDVAKRLLADWGSFVPAVRREAQEILFARPDRVAALLDAVRRGDVKANQIEPARLDLLRKHPNVALREQAQKVLASVQPADRKKAIDAYRPLLEKSGSAENGKRLFAKVCAACHRVENVGVEVGANLEAALPNKTPEQLLVDLLDPSKEVDPRFLQYVATLVDGRAITGLIAAETAASVVLRRADKQEDVVLRRQIESLQSTGLSLMPAGLETQLAPNDFVDLLTYLQSVGRKK